QIGLANNLASVIHPPWTTAGASQTTKVDHSPSVPQKRISRRYAGDRVGGVVGVRLARNLAGLVHDLGSAVVAAECAELPYPAVLPQSSAHLGCRRKEQEWK